MTEPFQFHSQVHLVWLLGRLARTARELLEGIHEVPAASIYYQTHRSLQQHHFASPEPTNAENPVGVVEVYRKVRRYVDCQLVIAGGWAADDPEGMKVLEEVRAAADEPDIHVLFLPPASDLEINALQRGSAVIMQKSLREGFGLTVAEVLWEAPPVIASAVGGILLQIAHRYSRICCIPSMGRRITSSSCSRNPGTSGGWARTAVSTSATTFSSRDTCAITCCCSCRCTTRERISLSCEGANAVRPEIGRERYS